VGKSGCNDSLFLVVTVDTLDEKASRNKVQWSLDADKTLRDPCRSFQPLGIQAQIFHLEPVAEGVGKK